MTGFFRQRSGRIWVLVSIILAALLLVPLPTLLVSRQQEPPDILVPMLFEKGFSIEYIHSVNRTPVQENFILVPGNDLLLTSTTFKALGVGTPFLPEEGKLENRNGLYVLSGINRRFKEINIAYVPLTRHCLVYRGKRYDFNDYFPSGSLISLQVKPYSLAKIILLSFKEGGKT